MIYKPHHTAISVRDLDKSVKFYEKLGFVEVHRYDEEDGSLTIVHMKLGDYFLEIFAYKSSQNLPPVNFEYANNLTELGVKHIALQADNLEEALQDFIQKGLATKDTEIKVGRTKVSYFFIQDPDGVWVEFVKDERYK